VQIRKAPAVGGDTLWASLYAAYEELSEPMKALCDGLTALHDALPHNHPEQMAIHPVVRVHPETGRKALFVSEAYTIGIDGMPEDEAADLLAELFAHQVEDRFVYRHRWSAGLLTMWDNRCVLHRATGGYEGHRRLLYRVTIAEPTTQPQAQPA